MFVGMQVYVDTLFCPGILPLTEVSLPAIWGKGAVLGHIEDTFREQTAGGDS